MGKPCIKGTRITVALILEKLAAGESLEQILRAHPGLVAEDIQAALAFAAVEKTRRGQENQPFISLAGAIQGTPGVSQRKGFSRG